MPGRCTMHAPGFSLSSCCPAGPSACCPPHTPILPRPAELAQLRLRLGSCLQPCSHAHPPSLFFVGSLSFAALWGRVALLPHILRDLRTSTPPGPRVLHEPGRGWTPSLLSPATNTHQEVLGPLQLLPSVSPSLQPLCTYNCSRQAPTPPASCRKPVPAPEGVAWHRGGNSRRWRRGVALNLTCPSPEGRCWGSDFRGGSWLGGGGVGAHTQVSPVSSSYLAAPSPDARRLFPTRWGRGGAGHRPLQPRPLGPAGPAPEVPTLWACPFLSREGGESQGSPEPQGDGCTARLLAACMTSFPQGAGITVPRSQMRLRETQSLCQPRF